jgi:hypothetical protein
VPYRKRPISPTYPGPGWPTWLTEDQRFVHLRPDVLSWQTDSLAQDLVVTGDITARLFASTSGTDSDWVVKLIDVYPENYGDDEMRGYQLIIADEVMRARFRNSFERPEPVPAGKAVEYAIGLHGNDHAFLKGHRIMVQVQSTWFPLIDRNPQKFVPNIFPGRRNGLSARDAADIPLQSAGIASGVAGRWTVTAQPKIARPRWIAARRCLFGAAARKARLAWIFGGRLGVGFEPVTRSMPDLVKLQAGERHGNSPAD